MISSLASSRLVLVLLFALALLVAISSAAPNARHPMARQPYGLMRRQMESGYYPVTGVQSGLRSNGSIPYRLEIRELQKDGDLWNLYLLGLERLQATEQSDKLSWYQIAGMSSRRLQSMGCNVQRDLAADLHLG